MQCHNFLKTDRNPARATNKHNPESIAEALGVWVETIRFVEAWPADVSVSLLYELLAIASIANRLIVLSPYLLVPEWLGRF